MPLYARYESQTGESRLTENRIVVIAGPTASGKSALAIDVAKEIGGIVVNADSMQVYRGIPIVTACPTMEERKIVEHRLFEIYDCSFHGNVVDWLKRAVDEIHSIWAENKIPVVVGGTGMYIDNLINGVTPIPETKMAVRKKVADILQEKGNTGVYALLEEWDPDSAQKLNVNDTTRISRAVEIYLDTGIRLSEWYQKPMIKKLPEAKFYTIKIAPKAEELDERCYKRLDLMIEKGALAEIETLDEMNLDRSLPSMKALGVPELLEYVQGKVSLSEALENAKLHTRQYAKRQRTWFKNKLKSDLELASCYQGDFEQIKEQIVSGIASLKRGHDE